MKNKELGFIYILSILTVFCVILNYLNIIPYYKFGIIFFSISCGIHNVYPKIINQWIYFKEIIFSFVINYD